MRQLVLDRSAQPVTNYWRNPKLAGLVKDAVSTASVAGPEAQVSTYSSGLFRIVDVADLTGFTRAVSFEAHDTGQRGVILGSAVSAIDAPKAIAGETWTISAWVHSNRADLVFFGFRFTSLPNMGGSYRAENAPAFSVPVGSWIRLSYTLTLSAMADPTYIGAQMRLGATGLAGDVVRMTGFSLTRGQSAGSYADGNTYNWRWTGTSGSSESVGYPEPVNYVRNLHRNPQQTSTGAAPAVANYAAGSTGTVTRTWATGVAGYYASTARQIAFTALGPSLSDRIGEWYESPASPGQVFTLSASMRRISGSLTKEIFIFVEFRNLAAATAPSREVYSGVLTSTSVRELVATTVEAPAGTVLVRYGFFVRGSGTGVAEAVTVDLTQFMLTAGAGVRDYADGTFPGWRWEGTANASTSVGPPYTLEQIAGTPLATATVAAPAGNVPFSIGTTDDRVLYAVADISADISGFDTITRIIPSTGDAGVGSFAIRTANSGINRIEGRIQPVTGATSFPQVPGSRTAGRHVICMWSEGAVAGFHVDDAVQNALGAVNGPLTGSNSILQLLPTTAQGDRPVIALVFRGPHDLVTRKRVMAWLARRYGAPVPAGY